MLPVFINVTKIGLHTWKSMAILCCFFVFTGYVSLMFFFPLHGCHVFVFPLVSMPFSSHDTNYMCFMNRPIMVKIISARPIILQIPSMEEWQVYFEPPVLLAGWNISVPGFCFWVLKKWKSLRMFWAPNTSQFLRIQFQLNSIGTE